MGNYVDYETEENSRKMLAYWFGSEAQNWQVTDRTVVAIADLLKETDQCGSIFKLVPTPSGAFSGVGIISSTVFNYAKAAIKRAATENTYYNTCVKAVAVKKKTEVYMTTN